MFGLIRIQKKRQVEENIVVLIAVIEPSKQKKTHLKHND